jgi:hypothetical protein
VSLFISDGIEVARTERDIGIDLLVFEKNQTLNEQLTVLPVKLKAFGNRGFSLNEKKYKNMYMAYVWLNGNSSEAEVYLMSFEQAVDIARTSYYNKYKNVYTGSPKKTLVAEMQKYRCRPGYLSDLMNSL